ncbi:Rho GTPase-activating protein 21 [Psilocybe cubensis]|uniref:Rho GTPase activating protein 22 n=2 Tax=Psilocybe cubensis TaxID=181762 RepID=A0A8H7Y5M8_PSICU|nr:Rho GTPase-activating protein 21 [Psilocybe cubensis]KAH9485798.1 Rho GTPase-activating protein 21 [Psilocybe cubensis]
MAPRRGLSPNNLAPQESLTPNGPSSSLQVQHPRSTSPSSGFTQFLSKPSKWFSRSASASKVPTSPPEFKPNASTGSRKHKISRPTDPRPIMDAYAGGASRSVLDLSARPPGSLELSRFQTPSTPSSPTNQRPAALGDLRNTSRKAWSRSADDLSKVSPALFSPIKTSFQDRVAEYRSRSDSAASAVSPSSPTSAGSIYNGHHPFPTVDPSPSTSPPRSATLPAVSISIEAPAPDQDSVPLSSSPTHVRTRSHSFTPKQSSKLATPRYPPSPQRANERDHDGRDGDQSFQGTPTRPTFNFGFGGVNQSKPQQESNVAPSPIASHRATTLLPPPTIVEPDQHKDEKDEMDPKRSSQILYHSGFINRLADVPANFNQANLPLSKGWKPFKLELKGSKLYFYKPPGDRANGIRDLFPTTLVPPSEQDNDDDNNAESSNAQSEDLDGSGRSRKGKAKDDGGPVAMARKKRAYWGRKTHPDLILDASGNVEKGTFEALTHEAVFATTFSIADTEASSEEGGKQRWQEFSASVIVSVPVVVGRQIFEVEFLRCCSYLVSGAEDTFQAEAKSRVSWLATEYLRCHGQPADAAAWDDWKRDTIPDVVLSCEGPEFSSAVPVTPSSKAVYQASPAPSDGSPHVHMFSPRPEGGAKMISLLEALSPLPPSHSSRQGLAPPNGRFPWSVLQEEGLTRDLLLRLDPYLVARSLALFHRSVLDMCPDNITVEFITGTPTRSEDENDNASSSSESFASLFGSDDHPHWLTKMVLLQILGTDNSSGHSYASQIPAHLSSPARRSEDRGNTQTSRTHSRSELVSVWARIGEFCRTAGDECSWKAISAALCSRPVARLDKVWKRVDPQALAAIESWANYVGEDGPPSVSQPAATVWGGDVKIRLNHEIAKATGDGEAMIPMGHVTKARSLFETFRKSFLLCPRKTYISENDIGDDLRNLVAYWRDTAAQGGMTSGLAVKFQRVEQFMSLSLAAEPRRKGLFEPFFWTRTSSQTPSTSLVPLLFPEPLPTITLIDRSKLVRGRYDSDNTDLQYLRSLDAQLRQEAGRQPLGFDVKQDFTKRLILGQGGTVISVYQGELLLVVQSGGFESAPNSRPTSSRISSRPGSTVTDHGVEKSVSRNPSIRVKPSSSQGLDRKTSIARRSSLPTVSHLSRANFVTAEPSSDPPLRVIVQAGTLNTLVNVLVHGLDKISVSVADDNGEMSLREGMTRELVVDRAEFAKVWWSVFRSFVTPFVFFELLRKIYISAQPPGSSPTIAQYMQVINKRSEVLSTTKEWLTSGGGAQDILDDTQLYNAVENFLDNTSDHLLFKSTMADAPPVQKAWESLMEEKDTVKATFISQTMRPTISRGHHQQRSQGRGARTRNISTREPPDLDRMDPEAFVDNLDGMACAAFSNVTQEDLYITADLLEVQTSDRTGWFSPRDVPSLEETVEIQTIYSQIQEVEPSSLISELSQDALYRLLPPGVRSCIRAYGIIRKWLISKLIAPRIGLRARQARMELLVQAIEVSRLRNTETPSTAQLMDQPCVRSFVEAVTTSAILSVESRLHSRAWQGVGANRGSACDSVASLLHRPYVQSTSSVESLTVDMGWLLERMLEIISTSDVIEASSQEGQNLVNFDKRRHLCNLIRKAGSLPSERKNADSEESHRRGFERLNNIEKEVLALQFDYRGIKEEAYKEATAPGVNGVPPSMKKAIRPFYRLVTAQVEKNRRDKTLRGRLQKEKIQEQSRIERRDDLLNRAMMRGPRGGSNKPISNPHHQGQGQHQQKQHRNKKSMSAFLNFMRPISSAFVSSDNSPQHLGLRRTPSKLDFATTGKPTLVLSILDAQVAQFINNERSYTFQLDTEDGGHYLLQATSKRDMTKWLETISRVTKNAAKRRLTYIGNSPKPQIADHIHSHPIVASRDPKAVFGVELEFLLRREAGSDHIPPGTVPVIIEQCLSAVEARGLMEVGIYRIAGATTEINALKEAYNKGEFPIRETTDVHAICDLVKSWFRVLPEPVFPASSYFEVMEAMRQENLEDRLQRIRQVVQALPQPNFDILRRVSEHLDKVTDYEEHNHMTAEALAIVFSPNLLRAPQNDFVMILNNMGLSHKLVKALITHFHIIFDEVDQEVEGENHSEDDENDLDSPILEEDEDEIPEEPSYEHDQQRHEHEHEPTHDRHDLVEPTTPQ